MGVVYDFHIIFAGPFSLLGPCSVYTRPLCCNNTESQIIHMCVLLGFKLQRAFSEHGYPELIFNLQKIDLIRIVDIEREFLLCFRGGGIGFLCILIEYEWPLFVHTVKIKNVKNSKQ